MKNLVLLNRLIIFAFDRISDIEKIGNKLLVGSLGSDINQGDLSYYIYTLDENQKYKREILKFFKS